MTAHPSRRVEENLALFGARIRLWRKLQHKTATLVAQQAGITRASLCAIETGQGGPRFDTVMAVAIVLGIQERLIDAADPYETDRGRLLMDAALESSESA